MRGSNVQGSERLLRRLKEWRRKKSRSSRGFDDNTADALSFGADLIFLATLIVPTLGILGVAVFGWPF